MSIMRCDRHGPWDSDLFEECQTCLNGFEMNDKSRGLYNKFRVVRTDGTSAIGGKHRAHIPRRGPDKDGADELMRLTNELEKFVDTWAQQHGMTAHKAPDWFMEFGRDMHQFFRAHLARASTPITEIAAERERQKSGEGWTTTHDDEHSEGQMADAAACYAATKPAFHKAWLERSPMEDRGDTPAPRLIQHSLWPWDARWWKPKDRRRDLVRAGALIIAEIERLDRAASPKGEVSDA